MPCPESHGWSVAELGSGQSLIKPSAYRAAAAGYAGPQRRGRIPPGRETPITVLPGGGSSKSEEPPED